MPPTQPTTHKPATQFNGVQYVNSQSMPNAQYNYNGNGNSIAGSQNQQQQTQRHQQQPSQPVPVLLECDATEYTTRMCHQFCTMEIRGWYGLCNITSKACACFGIPLSAVQEGNIRNKFSTSLFFNFISIYQNLEILRQTNTLLFAEPIAAIFHSTAPVAPTPTTTTTPKPTYTPPRPGYQQFYPPQQYLQQQLSTQQQQQWRPIQSPNNYQYNNNQFYPASSPTLLNAAASHSLKNQQQLQEAVPVRTAANTVGTNGQPVPPSISTPDNSANVVKQTSAPVPTSFNVPLDSEDLENNTSANGDGAGQSETTEKPTRRRRSLNDNPLDKDKDSLTGKDLSKKGECTKFKCAIACKRNSYLAPDCDPKCIDGQCWCECFPRL